MSDPDQPLSETLDDSPASNLTPNLSTTNLQGRTIRGYELYERIGAGGFGEVYHAFQPSVKRDVAIKVILPDHANQPDFIRRFEAEAQLVARLEHPHIVPLYDYWREPSGAYLVMRWLRGGSLRTVINRERLPLATVVQILNQVTAALTLAHRRAVIHRDLKPDNILMDEERNAYITDFGIAKDLNVVAERSDAGLSGSPGYISPEQIRGDTLTGRADIYSLGILLYEILVGERPFRASHAIALIMKHLNEPMPSLLTRRPDLSAAVNAVVQKAAAKAAEDRFAEAKDLAEAFRNALIDSALLSAHQIDPTRSASAAKLTPPLPSEAGRTSGFVGVSSSPSSLGDPTEATFTPSAGAISPLGSLYENPYKGLRAFQEADAGDFFGRNLLTQQLLTHLGGAAVVFQPLDTLTATPHPHFRGELKEPEAESPRFLAVVGPSGSGKSSVVRAGLVPALRRGALPGSKDWYIVELIPGPNPFEELEAALLRVATNSPSSLRDLLREDERGLLRAVKRILPDADSKLLLVIDQFEEVFTLSDDEPGRVHLLNSLAAAVADPRSPLRIVITLRADFYDRPLQYAAFGELLRQHTEVVLPMQPEELNQAIIEPARKIGLTLETGLVEAVLADLRDQPGTLPLLEYALTELFERRVDSTLTVAAYRASGGALGALARRADDLFINLNAGGQEAARQLFLRLVTPGDGTEDTRRRVLLPELATLTTDAAQMSMVIDRFSKYYLLTSDRDPSSRTPTLEVAHEALIRTWNRLREWLSAYREDLRIQRRLAAAAVDWGNSGQDRSFLATGARLEQFEAWAAQTGLALTHNESAFITASVEERTAQQAREAQRAQAKAALEASARQRLRLLVGVLAVTTVLGLSLTAFALNLRQIAADSAATAQANYIRSDSLRLATEADSLLKDHAGNAELAALLSIRSLNATYTPQADAALLDAVSRTYTLQAFVGHKQGITSVAFSLDGQSVLTGAGDGTARLWDAHTGALIRAFAVPDAIVNSVAFSPDGLLIATGSGTSVRLWSVSDNRVALKRLDGHKNIIFSLAFSPNSKTLATGSDDKSIRLWDVDSGQMLHELTGHASGVTSVAFAPDGKTLASGSADKSIRLWDTSSGQVISHWIAHDDVVNAVAFAPDGKTLASGSSDKSIRLWDVASGQMQHQLDGHTDQVRGLAYSADGAYLLSGSNDKTARLWDVANASELRVFSGHTNWVASVALRGNVALTGSEDGTARTWDAQPFDDPRMLRAHDARVFAVAVSPDGRYLATGSEDQSVRLWDRKTLKLLHQFDGLTDTVTALAFSSDSQRIAAGNGDKTVHIWNISVQGTPLVLQGHSEAVLALTFSPDGKWIVTGSADQSARIWDATTGQTMHTLSGATDGVFAVAVSPDGRLIATGSADKSVRLYDASSGKLIRTVTSSTGGVTALAFSPDGKALLMGMDSGAAQLVDVSSGQLIRLLSGQADSITSVAFSADGKYIATGSADKSTWVWDAVSGQPIRRLSGHTDQVAGVTFSPDGRTLYTASWDRTVRVWDTDYHAWLRFACSHMIRDLSSDERVLFNISGTESTCKEG